MGYSMRLLSRPYYHYKDKILPLFDNRRGTQRLLEVLKNLSEVGLEKINNEPIPLSECDFDNLVILDACRYDIYEEMFGETDSRITMGSMSKEFIKKNFSDNDFQDTIYITANPYFHETQFEDATGRKTEDVFHTVFHSYKNKWNSEKSTVMPEDVVEEAMTAEKLFPDKRKIIHFMQPHLPFINYSFSDFDMRSAIISDSKGDKTWDLAMKGELDRKELIDAYKDNLEVVKPHAEEIGEKLDGKTIISADHGTFLGENGLYKHPPKSSTKILRKVPWDEI
jgi:hypothetical protein